MKKKMKKTNRNRKRRPATEMENMPRRPRRVSDAEPIQHRDPYLITRAYECE
jgi:hypothetical protein